MNYKEIKESAPVVLVEFYASWCPHCQKMMPIVEAVKEKLGGNVPVYQFDIDKEQELSDKEGINTIPTFIIYKNGREEWRHSGELTEEQLYLQVGKY